MHYFDKSYPPSTQSVDILGYQRLVHLIPFLCGMGCKRSIVLEMEARVSVYLIIIIIIHPDIAIDEPAGHRLLTPAFTRTGHQRYMIMLIVACGKPLH